MKQGDQPRTHNTSGFRPVPGMSQQQLRDDQAGNRALDQDAQWHHHNPHRGHAEDGVAPGVAEHARVVNGGGRPDIVQGETAQVDAAQDDDDEGDDDADEDSFLLPGYDVVVEERDNGMILVQARPRKLKVYRKRKPSSPGYEALWAGGPSLAEEETNLWADLKDGPRQPGIDDDVPPVTDEENANWEREQARIMKRLRRLCEEPEEHPKSKCRLRPANRIWTKYGPPDRPELGRYPETARWVLCRQYWSEHNDYYDGKWLLSLAALPLSQLRWVLERVPLDLMELEDMSELAIIMVGAIELGHYRKARMLYEWSRKGQDTKWAEAEVWESCLDLGRLKAARYLLERWGPERLVLDRPDIYRQVVSAPTRALHSAAAFGDQAPDMIDCMLEHGADPNGSCLTEDDTPILQVTGKLQLHTRLRCLHKLLAAGANPNGKMTRGGHSSWESCPLAQHTDSPQMIRALLDAKADPDTFFHSKTPLLPILSAHATPKTALMLLEAGALTLVEPEWREGFMLNHPQPWVRVLPPGKGGSSLNPERFFIWPKHTGEPASFTVMSEAIRTKVDSSSPKHALFVALLQRMKAFPAPMAAHCCRQAELYWEKRRKRRGETQTMKSAPGSTLTIGCAQAAQCTPEILRLWLALGHPVSPVCLSVLERKYPMLRTSRGWSRPVGGGGAAADQSASANDNANNESGAVDKHGASGSASNYTRKRPKLARTDAHDDDFEGLQSLTTERQARRRQLLLEPAFQAVQRSTGLTSVVASLCLQAWVEDFEIRV